MAGNDLKKEPDSTHGDGKVEEPSPENNPVGGSGLRAEVDRKLDSLFDTLDSAEDGFEPDGDEDSAAEEEAPAAMLDDDGPTEQIRADMVGSLEGEEEAVVDWDDDAPEPGDRAETLIRETAPPEEETEAVLEDNGEDASVRDEPPAKPDIDDNAKPAAVPGDREPERAPDKPPLPEEKSAAPNPALAGENGINSDGVSAEQVETEKPEASDPPIEPSAPSPVSAISPETVSNTPPGPTKPDVPVTGRRQDPPPEDAPAERPLQPARDERVRTQPDLPPATPEIRKSLTSRIIVWGTVLIIIAFTIRYFAAYEPETPEPPPVGTSQLFHKIASPPPTAVSAPVVKPAPEKPAAAAPPAPPSPKAPEPAAKPAARVKAYKPRTYPYAIHMASLRTREAAEKELANYRRGFQAYLARVDLGKKGIWYRLFLGHFPNASSALDAIKKYRLKNALVSRTRYACLSGSYPSTAEAAAVSQLLTGKGFFPYTIVKGDAYHVFVGAYHTAAATEKLSRALSAKGLPGKLIER